MTTAGTYIFRLTATDSLGASSNDTMSVIVAAAPNTPPTVSAGGNRNITLPTSTSTPSGASATDPNAPITYAWSFVSGPKTPTISATTTLTPTFGAMTIAGTYIFRLTATDGLGASSNATMSVIVAPAPNTPPTINAEVIETSPSRQVPQPQVARQQLIQMHRLPMRGHLSQDLQHQRLQMAQRSPQPSVL